jgi:hypothetical protein
VTNTSIKWEPTDFAFAFGLKRELHPSVGYFEVELVTKRDGIKV